MTWLRTAAAASALFMVSFAVCSCGPVEPSQAEDRREAQGELLEPGTVRISMRGTPGGGIWPHFIVSADGVQIGNGTANTATSKVYSFAIGALGGGAHTIAITFDNDYFASSSDDRNLFVDWVDIGPLHMLSTDQRVRYDRGPLDGKNVTPGQSAVSSNGTLIFALPTVDLTMRGAMGGGAWPHYVVKVDGVQLVSGTANSPEPRVYVFNAEVKNGAAHLVTVSFDNDYWLPSNPKDDRNLFVDFMDVGLQRLKSTNSQVALMSNGTLTFQVPASLNSALPPQGVYEGIALTGNYQPRLDQLAANGFKVVLNYSAPGINPTSAQLVAYADAAQARGLKIIWAMKSHEWWDGTYSAAYIQAQVNAVKNHPATWGYYVADDDANMVPAKVISASKVIRTLDPNPDHPRLTVEGIADLNSGLLAALEPANDRVGYFDYPIGMFSTPQAQYESDDGPWRRALRLAKAKNKPFVAVLQANNVQACFPTIIYPYPHWPTATELTDFRNHVLSAADETNTPVSLILWFSYHCLTKANPAAVDTLRQGAFAPR